MSESTPPNLDQFVQLLTQYQPQLRALLEILLIDSNAASDVLQETNMLLWQKAAEYQPDTDFLAWASAVARFKALSYIRDARREKMVFDEHAVNQLATQAEKLMSSFDSRYEALRECLNQLSPRQRQLIQSRYFHDLSIREVAQDSGRTESGVMMSLSRIRRKLFDCIRHRLAQEAGS